jgi:flavodoxin
MKIGIIVHSQTGNTYSVAQSIQEALSRKGYSVNIERISAVNDKETDINKIQFKTLPNLKSYDALVFGAPVHAFNLCPGMTAYMSQIPSLQGKKIACFVTKGLPLNSTGGNQAISKMKKICESKGGDVCGSGIVVWNKGREKHITKIAEEMCKLF